MKLWNPIQPRRPTINEKGQPLLYRTHISHEGSRYKVLDHRLMKVQAYLYWWSRNEFANYVSQFDLHAYLFSNRELHFIKKRAVGMTIVQSTIYNPRTMKGATKADPRPRAMYFFQEPESFIYGLEWMLSMWIGRIASGSKFPTLEQTTEILEELVACENLDMVDEMIVHPMTMQGGTEDLDEVIWPVLWARFKWEEETEYKEACERRELVEAPKTQASRLQMKRMMAVNRPP